MVLYGRIGYDGVWFFSVKRDNDDTHSIITDDIAPLPKPDTAESLLSEFIILLHTNVMLLQNPSIFDNLIDRSKKMLTESSLRGVDYND